MADRFSDGELKIFNSPEGDDISDNERHVV